MYSTSTFIAIHPSFPFLSYTEHLFLFEGNKNYVESHFAAAEWKKKLLTLREREREREFCPSVRVYVCISVYMCLGVCVSVCLSSFSGGLSASSPKSTNSVLGLSVDLQCGLYIEEEKEDLTTSTTVSFLPSLLLSRIDKNCTFTLYYYCCTAYTLYNTRTNRTHSISLFLYHTPWSKIRHVTWLL